MKKDNQMEQGVLPFMKLGENEKRIKLSYGELTSPEFVGLINKLIQLPLDVAITAKLRYWFGRLAGFIEAQTNIYNRLRILILEDFCDRKEDGEPKIEPVKVTKLGKDENGKMVLQSSEDDAKDKNGNVITRYVISDQEKKKEFDKKIQELLGKEVTFSLFKIPIKVNEFPEILSSREMLIAEKIIEWK